MKHFFDKNINRAIVFICIAAILTLICNNSLGYTDAERTETVLKQFYELEDDSAEVILFGSSVTQRAYVTPVAYHEYGVPMYQLATATQPFIMAESLMKEAFRHQKPKLFVVELKTINKQSDWIGDVHIRRIIDNMEYSGNWFRTIRRVLKYVPKNANGIDSSGLSYYFRLLKYHSRWNPSKQPHYYEEIDYYTGYSPNSDLTFSVKKIKPLPYDEQHTVAIDEPTEDALNQFLDYCDTLEDSQVLFVMPPYQASEDGMGKMNYAKNIIEARGYEVLNMLTEENRAAAGLDDNTCYYNREHLNYYGSLKYTDFFVRYIKDHYGIEDWSDRGGHEAWEKEYERLMSDLDTKYQVRYIDMMADIKAAEKEGK